MSRRPSAGAKWIVGPLLALLTAPSGLSAAAGSKQVAVFDIGGPRKSARAGKYLAKRLRAHGARKLAAQGWKMMPRLEMIEALDDQGAHCVRSGECGAKAIKALEAALVVAGKMSSLGDLQLTLELRDGKTGKLVRDTALLAPRVDGLVEDLPKAWDALLKHLPDDDEPLVAAKRAGGGAAAAPADSGKPPAAVPQKPTTDASSAHGSVIRRGELTVGGAGRIDLGQMSAAVDRMLPQMHRCYGKRLAKDAGLAGVLHFELTLSKKGKVKQVKQSRNTTADKKLAACIGKRAKKWRLPKPFGGGVTVAFELDLSPKDQAAAAAATGADPDGLALKQQYGTISESKVESVVMKHISQIEKCYVRGWKKNPKLKGSLTVKFRISLGGRVQEAEVIDDELGSSKVSRCIRSRVLAWPFPKPTGGPALVHYPFNFG